MASYQKRGKTQTWSVRFNIIDDNGQEVTKRLSGFERKKDAEEAYRLYMHEYSKKPHKRKNQNNILDRMFIDVFEEYKIYKKDNLKESSYYDLLNTYDLHIKPYFQNYRLEQITKPIVLQWQQTLTKFSYKYKLKIRGILYSFYKYLFYYYDIDNIVARVEPFVRPNEKKEIRVWSYEEFERFIYQTKNDIVYQTFFTFLFYTGCRLGEALALKYSDFNFIKNTININKTLTTRTLNGKYAIASPKTRSSYRTILMPKKLVGTISNYLLAQPEVKTSEFFFGCTKPLDDHTIYRRLEMYAKQADVPKIRIHDFRHSHASFLIQNGASIVLVAKRLGHTNTEQTLNTYAHLFPNSENDLIEIINKKSK